MSETENVEAMVETIEAIPHLDTTAVDAPVVQDENKITIPQKPHTCALCERVFKYGDYVCITTFPKPNGEETRGILCKKCFGSGKDRADTKIVLFTQGAVSTVGRDRAWKRVKKLQRMQKKQGR